MRLPHVRFTVRRMIVVVAFVSVCLTGGGLFDRWLWRNTGGFSGSGTDDLSPAEIEYYARITLLSGAEDLRSYISGFQDKTIWVRFEIPADRVSQFLSGLRPQVSLTPMSRLPEAMRIKPNHVGWWSPEGARRFEAGEREWPSGHGCVLLDRTESRTITVYVLTLYR